MGIRETKKDNSELFKWDGKPSAGQVFPLAAQHVLAAVVGCVTPAILVANAANNAGGNVDMGLLIHLSLRRCLRCFSYMEIKSGSDRGFR